MQLRLSRANVGRTRNVSGLGLGNTPAHCQRCGHAFFAPLHFGAALTLSFQNVGVNRPLCGGQARVVEGTFNFDPDQKTFAQTDDVPLDSEIFSRLGLILLQAKKEQSKPEEVIERIGPHSPTIAKRLAEIMDDPQVSATVLAALIALFGAVTTALIISGDAPPQINNSITVEPDPSDDELDRLMDWLMEFRGKKAPIPSWVRDYIEPQES